MGLREYYKNKRLQHKLNKEAKRQELLQKAEAAKERQKELEEEAAARKQIAETRRQEWKQSFAGRAANKLEGFANKMSSTKRRRSSWSRRSTEPDMFGGNLFSMGTSTKGGDIFGTDIGMFPKKRKRKQKRKKRRR